MHVLSVGLQEPVLPPHAVVFVDEHWRHAPFTHAGKFGSGHDCALPEPLSPPHVVHPPARQTGRPPPQSVVCVAAVHV